MDKFTVHRTGKSNGYRQISIDVSTYEKLSKMKDDTGASFTSLIVLMTDFCAERLEVEE